MTNQDILDEFGVTSDQLDAWEEDASNGILHGEPHGKVIKGRPLLFGQRMQQVGFREPSQKVAAIDERAKQLGMRRSDYLRFLVDEDLKLAGLA